MREAPVILNNPLVHLMGPGTRAPAVSSVRNLLLELCVFLLEFELCHLELLASHS